MTLDLSWMLIMPQPNVVFVLTDDQGYGDEKEDNFDENNG